MVARRRGLSPLVATVVLISATIIGGMLVYNYFQKSVNVIASKSGSLQLSVDYSYLNSTHKLVYIEVYNAYADKVILKSVKVIHPDGSVTTAAILENRVNQPLAPNTKYSIVAVVPNDVTAVYLTYTIGDSNVELTTSPVRLG